MIKIVTRVARRTFPIAPTHEWELCSMMKGTLLIPLMLGILGGCSYGRSDSAFEAWIDRAANESELHPEPGAWSIGMPQSSADRGGDEVALPETAGVEDFVLLALKRNPAVRAAEQRIHRLANRIPQVTALDDPMLRLAPIGEMAETAAGQVNVMTSISQRLPLPGKLQARGRIAEQDAAEAVQQLEEVRLRVVADTRLAWWSHYDATRAIEVTKRNRALVSQFKDVADAKFRAGTAAQQDVLRASLEVHNLNNELLALAQRRTSAQAMLNRLIDRPADTAISEPAIQSIEEIGLELGALVTEASAAHPALQRIRERVEGFRQRYKLARLNRWPDLTVSFNYNLVESDGLSPIANGDDQWWIGFGINVPIWTERLDAAEREALRGRLENIAAFNNERTIVEFRIQDALAKVGAHQQQAILFRDVIVPQAEQTVDASLSSYRAGKVEFLTLIDNWRKLLVFERTYHEHFAQLEQSFAELQRAVGHDLARQSSQPSSDPNED